MDIIYADYWAALDAFTVPPGWFEGLKNPPTTKDQVFYGLNALDGNSGAVLAAEEQAQIG